MPFILYKTQNICINSYEINKYLSAFSFGSFGTMPMNPIQSCFVRRASSASVYIPLSDDEHRFVQKVHSAHENGHWERGRNSNPICYITTCRCCIVCNHLIGICVGVGIIAVCIYCYVISLSLWNKYDIDRHYSRFAACILVNPCQI